MNKWASEWVVNGEWSFGSLSDGEQIENLWQSLAAANCGALHLLLAFVLIDCLINWLTNELLMQDKPTAGEKWKANRKRKTESEERRAKKNETLFT